MCTFPASRLARLPSLDGEAPRPFAACIPLPFRAYSRPISQVSPAVNAPLLVWASVPPCEGLPQVGRVLYLFCALSGLISALAASFPVPRGRGVEILALPTSCRWAPVHQYLSPGNFRFFAAKYKTLPRRSQAAPCGKPKRGRGVPRAAPFVSGAGAAALGAVSAPQGRGLGCLPP